MKFWIHVTSTWLPEVKVHSIYKQQTACTYTKIKAVRLISQLKFTIDIVLKIHKIKKVICHQSIQYIIFVENNQKSLQCKLDCCHKKYLSLFIAHSRVVNIVLRWDDIWSKHLNNMTFTGTCLLGFLVFYYIVTKKSFNIFINGT